MLRRESFKPWSIFKNLPKQKGRSFLREILSDLHSAQGSCIGVLRMTAFEEFGVMPELGAAVDEMGWTLPTDVQVAT